VEDHVLCGCKGTYSSIDLREGIRHFALDSALNDSRFSPIKASKLLQCSCSVSILDGFEDCQGYDDWSIGVHGVSIEFLNNSGKYSAIFLPEVMTEHGTINYRIYSL